MLVFGVRWRLHIHRAVLGGGDRVAVLIQRRRAELITQVVKGFILHEKIVISLSSKLHLK